MDRPLVTNRRSRTGECGKSSIPDVVSLMIGRRYSEVEPSESYADRSGAALRLEGLAVAGQVEDVTPSVAARTRPGPACGSDRPEGLAKCNV
jgi:hypothetical protein